MFEVMMYDGGIHRSEELYEAIEDAEEWSFRRPGAHSCSL